jgi:DME family drug/metabolite transporter
VLGRKLFHIENRDWLMMALQGTLMAISHAAYFAAIRYTGVSIATLITLCIAPVIVSSISVLFKLERMSQRLMISLVTAIVGTILLVGFDAPQVAQGDLLLGTIFALIAALTYGSTLVCGRILAPKYHPLQITGISFSVATIVLLLINLLNGLVTVHTTQGWLLLLYLGLVPTAFAYWLFQMGLRSVSATAASILSIIDPLVAALLAWLIFGETLAATGIIGAILLILSIFLLSLEQTQ